MISPSTDRDALIQHLFDEVADLDVEGRTVRLNQVCADAPDLRRKVEALLKAQAHTADLFAPLDRPGTASATTSIQPGQTLSHYRIEEKLGGGGMGVVYRATDTRLDRPVALKFLPSHRSLDQEVKARFIHEAKAASALDHPNICTIYDIDKTDEGQLFIVMAFYQGETLKKKIARGLMPIEEAIDYAVQVSLGLSQAHENGIVHRDVKPANVMITEDKVAKIVDFGLAKMADVSLTKTGTTLGTVAYMSPEQAQGQEVNHRTDLWSLGVVLYEMLTGERPFGGDYTDAIIYAIRHDEPESLRALRPEVPEALEQIVEKTLAKNPDERYQHAGEMLADLGAPQRIRDQAQLASPSALPSRRRRALRYGSAAALALVLALVGYALFTGGRASIDSIAVLPLVNLSSDPGLEYLADGMTDALIDHLSQIEALHRVISFTTIRQYKQAPRPLPEVAQQLNVAAVVEGTMQTAGDQVTIRVRLFDAATESRLWEQSFERMMEDMLTLQHEVALAITEAIALQVTPREQTRLKSAAVVDTAAYNLYLRGRHFLFNRNLADHRRAMRYFEASVKKDSTFAPAYAGLATSYLYQVYWGGMAREEAQPKAEQALARALALDEGLSEAYVVQGLMQYLQPIVRQWNEAEQNFRHAIELNPGNAEAHRELGLFLLRSGQAEEAVVEAKRAVELNPLFGEALGGLAAAYYANRQYDEAIAQIQSLRELYPGAGDWSLYYILVLSYAQKGMTEEALGVLEGPARLSEGPAVPRFLGIHGYTYAVLGRREEALEMLDALMKYWEQGRWVAGPIAAVYTGLGDKDRAFEWLDRWFERSTYIDLIRVDPLFDPLRADPRFAVLLEKLDRFEGRR